MNSTELQWYFDNQSQWNYSLMTWVNGTSYGQTLPVNVAGMDVVILLLTVIAICLLYLVFMAIRQKRWF